MAKYDKQNPSIKVYNNYIMKKAAKVFLIIGMVFQFFLIYPIILGALAIKKLNSAKTTDDLMAWGIVSILFVSILGGAFMLCVKQEELGPLPVKETKAPQKEEENDASKRLFELKSLLDAGIIDQETYEEKRKKIIEEL